MNRRKKAKGIFSKKLKKARAKLNTTASKKPRYISKADRELAGTDGDVAEGIVEGAVEEMVEESTVDGAAETPLVE